MTVRILFLILTFATMACAPTTPTFDAPLDTTATLRIFQEQRECCYTEGQVSFLSVGGEEHEIRLSSFGLVPLIELEVPIEEQEVASWQRPCSGNCSSLDPPQNQCSITVTPTTGDTIRLLVSFEPGPDPCLITRLEGEPETTVPVDFGFRTQMPSCGEDFTMQMAMFGDLSSESPERRCFVEAHEGGEPAELAAYEPPDPNATSDDILDLFVYRTGPNRALEVFVNSGPDFEQWLTYRCGSLEEVDGPRLFTLEDCTDPVELR
jgi:hypothetical protein